MASYLHEADRTRCGGVSLTAVEPSNANYSFASQFAHGLVTAGVTHVCISPGSRNTPLALTLGRHPALTDWVIHDERSSAFFALGLGRATGVPAVLVCTSGSAAAEYFPAIVEAAAGRVPLVVVTADRPPELRNVGAPQAIDQIDLYGRAVRWFHDTGAPDGHTIATASALAVRACLEATRALAGPVHVNVPMREPLAPIAGEGVRRPASGRESPTALAGSLQLDAAALAGVAGRITGRRAIIVAGAERGDGYPEAIVELATALEAPVLADVLSGVRNGVHDQRLVLAAPDLLAGAGVLDRFPPDVVVRCGALPTEKSVWRWLEDHPEVDQILVDPAGWRDPIASAATVVAADPAALCRALASRVHAGPVDWAAGWIRADLAASQAALDTVGDGVNEPNVAGAVLAATSEDSVVVAASSMPVRDLGFLPFKTDRGFRVISNRGANGIDGTISTALGVAATAPTTLLVGDVAALHDVGALRTAALLGLPLSIVVIHNDGGGIFQFLKQADAAVVPPADFERYLATPHGTDFVSAAAALGVPAVAIDDMATLRQWLAEPAGGPRLAQVTTDRRHNEQLHRHVREAATRALD